MKKRWNPGWRGRGNSKRARPFTRGTPSATPQPPVDDNCPYFGWLEYFPDDPYVPESPLVARLRIFVSVFEDMLLDVSLFEQIYLKGSFTLDLESFVAKPIIQEGIPDFLGLLRTTPDIMIRSLSLSLYHVLSSAESGTQAIHTIPQVIARLSKFGPITPLKDLRANLYGKFATVQGTVVRVSDIKPLVTHLQFTCANCSLDIAHPLKDGKYTNPSPCCGMIPTPVHSGPLTRTIDLQKVRLQEVVSEEQNEAGRIPRTVECELTGDLVGACIPGENVSVTGIVKVHHGGDEHRAKNARDKCMFLLYVHANYVGSSSSSGDSALVITMSDILEINALTQKYPFGALVNSLCPTIFGHTLVKAGLVLALVGGTDRSSDSVSGLHKRSDSHVLIVGDPGLGKSQLLQAVGNVAPRGVYVCGNSATAAGLTVTLTRDGSDTVLEAGALVLADKGCCCIDEFDKMGAQHSALLEAMEQQSISIAKAGMVCSLPARTAVLAAANPVGGHFNPRKSVADNLKLSTPLLSRFDLIFILLDRPDSGLDKYLSDHVLAMHAGESSSQVPPHQSDLPLEQKLMSCKDQLEPLQMKKYIAHVRSTIQPVLSDDAKAVLKEYYLQLRSEDNSDETPITTRQLESLIRLTESRARVAQRGVATSADAIDVVEIFQHCMRDAKADRNAAGPSGTGKTMGVGKASKLLIAALNRHSEQTCTSLFSVVEIKEVMARAKIEVRSFDSLMFALNDQGFLLKKGTNIFQLQTSTCL